MSEKPYVNTFGVRLRDARRHAHLTQAALAVSLGVTPQAVSGWERDENMPEADKLTKLASLVNVPLAFLITEEEAQFTYLADVIEGHRRDRNLPSKAVPGDLLVGARDFPIYAATQGGDGHAIIHSDVMEWVKRPVILEGVPDSYGIYIVGDSMVPAYRPKDMALVHPRLPMERDTDVVLYEHDHRSGEAKSMIKRLLGFNDRQLKLEQYNPAKVFNEHRADWPICHQVVGMYKGRR